MLNCSGGWKLIVTDIGRGPLAVNRRPRYHTATHGSPRPRAPDLGGGSRPRPDEDGGDRARRRRRGTRAPSTARDRDRKSTRLNSSHLVISYAVFCLKKKNETNVTPAALHTAASNALRTFVPI